MTGRKLATKPGNDAGNSIKLNFPREGVPAATGHAGVDSFRLKAWESFHALTLPGKKDETWKRVDFSRFPFDQLATANSGASTRRAVDLVENLDDVLSTGVYVGTIREATGAYPQVIEKACSGLIDAGQDLFAALPAAFSETGFFLYVPEGLQVNEPLRIRLKRMEGRDALYNHLIWMEPGSRVQIILEDGMVRDGDKPVLRIGNLGLHIGRNANLKFIQPHGATEQESLIAHDKAVLEAEGQLEWLVLDTEGRFTKHFVQVDLAGRGATVKMAGLYLGSGSREVEFNTRQNHLAPDTKSDLLYKGVLLDESRSLFSGMIHVSPEAVKTDGYQANRNLIIGTGAHADTLPGLEILTDDVRCTHGATVGKIDPDELFYLQSRGLDDLDAKRMIIQGFLDPILQMLPGDAERESLQLQIDEKIG